MNSRKTSLWDGEHKRVVRAAKVAAVVSAQRAQVLPGPAALKTLSFAGARASFERALVQRGVSPATGITTIQTCNRVGGHEGADVLKSLLQVRRTELPGMRVWPYSFSSFVTGWQGEQPLLPRFSGPGQRPRWYQNMAFRRAMEEFLDARPEPFHVLDIDICGGFSAQVGEDISTLLRNGMLARRGLLFINHQKGRDGRGGRLFGFLRDFFARHRHLFDLAELQHPETGEYIDFQHEDYLSYYLVRYVLVPIYYICQAYNYGYVLEVDRLFEYCDRNPETGAGVNMLQWFFRFNQSRRFQHKPGSTQFLDAVKLDTEATMAEIQLVASEGYPYFSRGLTAEEGADGEEEVGVEA